MPSSMPRRSAAISLLRSAGFSPMCQVPWPTTGTSPSPKRILRIPEAPQVSFQVAATEAATTIILVLQFDDDLRACGLRLGVKRIGAVDHHVDALRRGAADFVRLAQLARERRIGHRAEHQHAVSER